MDVFNLVIQRDVTVDIQELLALSDPHLRQRLAAILEQGVQQLQAPDADRPPVLAPDWFNSLELAFDALAAPEMLEEGPALYIHNWFIDAATATRCPVSPPAPLRQDRRIWRSEIIAVWQDQVQSQRNVGNELNSTRTRSS